MKRRWKQTAGFTLVELIVVIAILGTLAGIAVPTYSGYMKKANMAADETLVNDVKTALTLYYLGHPGENLTGYVELGTSGSAADPNGEAAMDAVFGDGWEDRLSLKYNGWSSGGLLGLVANMSQTDAENIANSTFLTESTPGRMMDATTNLLGIATDRIFESENVANRLEQLGGELSNDLNKLGSLSEEEKSVAISNLLVGHFANALTGVGSSPTETTNDVSRLVTFYASLYAYSEHSEDSSLLDAVNAKLADPNTGFDDLKPSTFQDVIEDMDTFEDFVDFDAENWENNNKAVLEMMKAVGKVSGNYKDKDSLTDAGLFSSESKVMDDVNGYVNAIKAKADGTLPDHDISAGGVLVMLYEDGSTGSTLALNE